MGQKRYTAEQIIGKLRQAEVVSICPLRALPEHCSELRPIFVSYNLITGACRRD